MPRTGFFPSSELLLSFHTEQETFEICVTLISLIFRWKDSVSSLLAFPGFVLLQELAFSCQMYCNDHSSVLTIQCSRDMLSGQFKQNINKQTKNKKETLLANILVRLIIVF